MCWEKIGLVSRTYFLNIAKLKINIFQDQMLETLRVENGKLTWNLLNISWNGVGKSITTMRVMRDVE